MALETTFRDLSTTLQNGARVLKEFRRTIHDKPPDQGAAVADGLSDATLHMAGLLRQMRAAAAEAEKAVGGPIDLDRARRALTLCQQHFRKLEEDFNEEVLSYDKLSSLAHIGRTRRGEWPGWASTTQLRIEQFRECTKQAGQSLTACWQELAERLGTMSISVQTTNVGQQISVPKARVNDLEAEGVT